MLWGQVEYAQVPSAVQYAATEKSLPWRSCILLRGVTKVTELERCPKMCLYLHDTAFSHSHLESLFKLLHIVSYLMSCILQERAPRGAGHIAFNERQYL
ncbi:hypothetical protein FKM82_006151 [Ascaphus truei]